MTAAIEAMARATGMMTLRLGANRALVEAQALCRKLGDQGVARLDVNRHAHHWFTKQL